MLLLAVTFAVFLAAPPFFLRLGLEFLDLVRRLDGIGMVLLNSLVDAPFLLFAHVFKRTIKGLLLLQVGPGFLEHRNSHTDFLFKRRHPFPLNSSCATDGFFAGQPIDTISLAALCSQTGFGLLQACRRRLAFLLENLNMLTMGLLQAACPLTFRIVQLLLVFQFFLQLRCNVGRTLHFLLQAFHFALQLIGVGNGLRRLPG